MYVYNVGYGSPEESEYSQLCHETKYSKEEFHQIILKAIEEVLIDVLEEEEFHCKVYLDEDGISYQNIHPLVVGKLLMNFGFRKLYYEAMWSCFGWSSITQNQEESWRGYKGSANERIITGLPEELKKQINNLGIQETELRDQKFHNWVAHNEL